MVRFFTLDSRGRPKLELDPKRWLAQYTSSERNHVGLTEWPVKGGLRRVSTTFIAGGDPSSRNPPAVWESIAFEQTHGDVTVLHQRWYTSEAAAREGHEVMVFEMGGPIGGPTEATD